MSVAGATQAEADALRKLISSHYSSILYAQGTSSMQGFCGTVVGYQLNLLGIDKQIGPRNGNDFFDHYKNMRVTPGGYLVKTYAAGDYSLRDALMTASNNGTKDVRNLIVCFSRTNTEEGQRYGHACMIYGILDGQIYYCESYDRGTYREGQPCCIDIDTFVEYYSEWATFQGVVQFDQQMVEGGQSTDVFVEALRDIPMKNGQENDSGILRTVMKGERLHACCLYERDGVYYYQIIDGDEMGYIPAKAATLFLWNPDCFTLEGGGMKTSVPYGKRPPLQGTVRAWAGDLTGVDITVSNGDGTFVDFSQEVSGSTFDLTGNKVRQALSAGVLPKGEYILTVTAHGKIPFARYGRPRTQKVEQVVYQVCFAVGQPLDDGVGLQSTPDGWSYRDGFWWLYRDGAPVTGWVEEHGIRYFLKEDGSAATGDTEIDGMTRHFSSTGALLSGWYSENGELYYRNEDGSFATGSQEIDGKQYCFSEDGKMQKNCWIKVNGSRYYLRADGTPATGWAHTDKGFCLFGKDGSLKAQMQEKDGKYQIVPPQ